MATRIIPVIYPNGDTVSASVLGGHPGAVAFEIFDGEHAGKRGSDTALYELVGPVAVDWTLFSMYETGERMCCDLCRRGSEDDTVQTEGRPIRLISLAKCLDGAVGP